MDYSNTFFCSTFTTDRANPTTQLDALATMQYCLVGVPLKVTLLKTPVKLYSRFQLQDAFGGASRL